MFVLVHKEKSLGIDLYTETAVGIVNNSYILFVFFMLSMVVSIVNL